MKINTKVRYGLRAMLEIADPLNSTGTLQKDIALRQDIPLNYLDGIISGLRNAGLIVNFQGKSSGYLLARKVDEISVYDIYRAFEPDLQLVNCSCVTNECKRSFTCPAKDYWLGLTNQIKKIMENTCITSLLKPNQNSSLLELIHV